MTDHTWANVIIRGAKEDGAMAIIEAINQITASGRANTGSCAVACAQILAQIVVQADPRDAPEVRQGIMSLIDDYAIRLAVEKS
jgi:hypothetical protein